MWLFIFRSFCSCRISLTLHGVRGHSDFVLIHVILNLMLVLILCGLPSAHLNTVSVCPTMCCPSNTRPMCPTMCPFSPGSVFPTILINPMTSTWVVSHPGGGRVSVSKSAFLLQYCPFGASILVHLPTTT